ncbi:hypothetical protein HBI70_213560 [Parastagonospora nodorum]|nr:hypothetical protein HBI70_213560 [Parastagonospora nodorum]
MKRFDRETGVVYTETTSAVVESMVPTWMYQARGKCSKKSTLRSRGSGCSTLQAMALRSCAFHADFFEPETLQWGGWHYASRIYHHLLTTEALTYNSWAIFQAAYPADINPHQHFHIPPSTHTYAPTLLPSLTSRLSTLSHPLITHLCIRNFALKFTDLTSLLCIPTLGALVLEQARPGGQSEITSRHFLDFARAAREKGTLQRLRVLVVCDFGLGKGVVLRGMSGFPALRLVGVVNSKTSVMHGEDVAGWRCVEEDELGKGVNGVWNASYLTSEKKMQELYRLAGARGGERGVEERSVSITYGGGMGRSMYEATAWFVRDHAVQAEEMKKPEVGQQRVEGGVAKKRKIRTGKQMDVGSFLGAFK